MENISQNPLPKKRGRPQKMSEAWWRAINSVESCHSSHRHRANAIYGARAHMVLKDDPRCAWRFQRYRSTIMDELGRVDDDQNLVAIARYLCEHQPTLRQALALIREYRLLSLPG